MILDQNTFIEILPGSVASPLAREDLDAYRKRYSTRDSRLPGRDRLGGKVSILSLPPPRTDPQLVPQMPGSDVRMLVFSAEPGSYDASRLELLSSPGGEASPG
jgi:hypothetical protein